MSSIAVINAGSSSIKFAVFEATPSLLLLLRGRIEGIGAKPAAKLFNADGKLLADQEFPTESFDHAAATRAMIQISGKRLDGRDVSAVGHRIVHGGAEYSAPVRLTDQIIERLTSFIPLAPLHQPHNLAAIRAIRTAHPDLCRRSPVLTRRSIAASQRSLRPLQSRGNIPRLASGVTGSMEFPTSMFQASSKPLLRPLPTGA